MTIPMNVSLAGQPNRNMRVYENRLAEQPKETETETPVIPCPPETTTFSTPRAVVQDDGTMDVVSYDFVTKDNCPYGDIIQSITKSQ
jgi:hypothetical protein